MEESNNRIESHNNNRGLSEFNIRRTKFNHSELRHTIGEQEQPNKNNTQSTINA